MAKRNRNCALCGSNYQYCDTCREFLEYPVWMNTFCSNECLNVYETMVSYVNKKITKTDAKKILVGYQCSNKYKNYKGSFAATYAEIMSKDEKEENLNITETIEEPVEKTKEEIEETEKTVEQNLAQETAAQVRKNTISEGKKFYSKAVAHKHGK